MNSTPPSGLRRQHHGGPRIKPPGSASKNPTDKHGYGNTGITPPSNVLDKMTNKDVVLDLKKTMFPSSMAADNKQLQAVRKERDDAIQLSEKFAQQLKETQVKLAIRDEFDREEDILQKKKVARLEKERDVAISQNAMLEQELQETRAQVAVLSTTSSKTRPYQRESELLQREHDEVVMQNAELKRQLREIRRQFAACREEYEQQQKKQKTVLAALLDTYNIPNDQNPPEEESILGPIDLNLVETTKRIGDYRVREYLGHGEFAQVRKGIHRKTCKEYAIKSIEKKRLPIHHIEQEVMILMQLNHPNIIQAVQIYNAPSVVYVVMELGYMDLHEYHSKGKMNKDDVREAMIGILEPIELLHSLGICHSDLKKENVLIMNMEAPFDRSNIKLCDFGLCSFSNSADPDTPVYQDDFKGTIPLVAPEVVTTKGPYDARPVDMWAIGCILLELTIGFPDGWEEAYKLHKIDTAGFEQGIRDSLQRLYEQRYVVDFGMFDIVRSLLKVEPEARHTASQVLDHEWFEGCFLESEGRESICL